MKVRGQQAYSVVETNVLESVKLSAAGVSEIGLVMALADSLRPLSIGTRVRHATKRGST